MSGEALQCIKESDNCSNCSKMRCPLAAIPARSHPAVRKTALDPSCLRKFRNAEEVMTRKHRTHHTFVWTRIHLTPLEHSGLRGLGSTRKPRAKSDNADLATKWHHTRSLIWQLDLQGQKLHAVVYSNCDTTLSGSGPEGSEARS